jgi:hypothetical protein
MIPRHFYTAWMMVVEVFQSTLAYWTAMMNFQRKWCVCSACPHPATALLHTKCSKLAKNRCFTTQCLVLKGNEKQSRWSTHPILRQRHGQNSRKPALICCWKLRSFFWEKSDSR